MDKLSYRGCHKRPHTYSRSATSVELSDHTAQNLGALVLQLVDVVLNGTGGHLSRDIEFGQPFFHLGKDAGIGRYRENGVDAIDGKELDRSMISRKRVGLENLLELARDVGGTAVTYLEGAHTLPRESIAVEHGD